MGASNTRLLFTRVIPNALTPLIVQGTLGIATAILSGAALSFLGLGAQPPIPEWGQMLSEERNSVFNAPHLVILPGLGDHAAGAGLQPDRRCPARCAGSAPARLRRQVGLSIHPRLQKAGMLVLGIISKIWATKRPHPPAPAPNSGRGWLILREFSRRMRRENTRLKSPAPNLACHQGALARRGPGGGGNFLIGNFPLIQTVLFLYYNAFKPLTDL